MSTSSLAAVAAATVLSLAFCGSSVASTPRPTQANTQQYTVGSILLCDKAEQVEAFFASSKTAASETTGPSPSASCGVVTAVFRAQAGGKTMLLSNGIVHIVKIEMVGMRAGDTWVKMSKPFSGYAGVVEAATIA